MIFRDGRVDASSNNGENTVTAEINQGGWKPNTWVHISITGWSFKFKSRDHRILEMGIFLQDAQRGEWTWSTGGVWADENGNIKARFFVFTGSENRDNPFDAVVCWGAIGE